MNQRSHSTEGRDRPSRAAPHSHTGGDDASTPRTLSGGKRLLGDVLRGCAFAGAGLLLATCPTLLGTVPAGIALVSASSSYTWWIAAGAILGAFLQPQALSSWAWVGVYAFLLILRLCIRFFVDPPSSPDGRPLRVGVYLSLCLGSFRRNVGLPPDGETVPHDFHPLPGYKTPEMQLFGEHPFLRMLTAAVAGFTAGLFELLANGFHVYDLLGMLFLLFICPALTFLLVSLFGEAGLTLLFSPTPLQDMPLREDTAAAEASPKDSRFPDGGLTARFAWLPLLSVLSLLTLTVFSARDYRLPPAFPYLQVELSLLLAIPFSLIAASRLGMIAGIAVAVTTGLAVSPRLAPVIILAVCGYALLRVLSTRAGLLGGCTVGAVWCAMVEGVGTLVRYLPAILLAIPVCLLAERITAAFPLSDAEAHTDREVEDFAASVSAALAAERRAEAGRLRIGALSSALSSLSRLFSDLSGQLRRPKPNDLLRICEEALSARCARCRHCDTCHRRESARISEACTHLSGVLERNARLTMEDFPAYFFEFCPHAEDILEDIHHRYAHLRETLDKNERTDIFAADYAAMAALLGDALEADRAEAESMTANRTLADRIFNSLTERGMTVHGVVVTGREESGRRRVILQGEHLLGEQSDTAPLRHLLEELCDAPLSDPTVENAVGGDTVLTFAPRARLRAAFAGSTVPADHPHAAPLPGSLTDHTPTGTYTPPAVCGDHIALFHGGEGYFYALISDGMGSGEGASLTSEICASFLQKMLAAGGRAELSLRMLENYLRAKNAGTGDECSATVDLMELDLMDGHAVFAKSGSAPTYVVRDGTVYKLRSRSLPLGILRRTDPDFLRFRTNPGDVVVMVSDGVTRGQDECPWLIDLLSTPMPRDMDVLRRDIIRRALSAGSEDDLSAIAIRVDRR